MSDDGKGLGKLAVVTGASSGLGEEFAYQLGVKRGWSLVLSARRKERLERLRERVLRDSSNSSLQVFVVPADLTRAGDRASLMEAVDELDMIPKLLVNNAGFGSVGAFADLERERELEMIELNCKASVDLAHRFFERMKQQGGGSIITVCSTAAFQPLPYMATYAATKAFLLSHSVALNVEGGPHGIRVLAHCPGPVHTEFHLHAGLKQKLDNLPAMESPQVVHETLRALERGKSLVLHGVANRSLALLSRVCGPRASARLASLVLKKEA